MRFNSDHGNNRLATSHMACWEPKKLRGFSIENLSVEDSSYGDQFFPVKKEMLPSLKPAPTGLPSMVTKNKRFPADLQQESWTIQSLSFGKGSTMKLHDRNANEKEREWHLDFQTESGIIKRRSNLETTSTTLPLKLSTRSYVAPNRSQIGETFPDHTQTLSALDDNVISANEMSHDKTENIHSYGKTIQVFETDLNALGKEIHHRHGPIISISTKMQNTSDSDGSKTNVDKENKNKETKSGQNDLISWLVVAMIITAIFAATMCGVVVVNKQLDRNGTRCCCCRNSSNSTRQQTSESIRSFSNYPLLYDNPLARRPLPRQPTHYPYDQRSLDQPMRANSSNGQVDIQWTCGGTFGIGDVEPSGSQLLKSPAKEFRRGSAEGYPPMIPPRLPKNVRNWSNKGDQSITFNPRLLSASARNISRPPSNRLPITAEGSMSFSDIRNAKSIDDSDQKQDFNRIKQSHRKQPKKRSESVIGIEKNLQTGEFNLMTNSRFVQKGFDGQCISAPITRQSSYDAPYQISRKTKRQHIMMQLLEVLEEIDASRRNSNAAENNKANKRMGSHSQRELHNRMVKQCFPSMTAESDEEVFGSFATENISATKLRGEKRVNEQRKEDTKERKRNAMKGSNSKDPSFKNMKINNDECAKYNHLSHIADIDLEFPPPPPCVAMSCSEDSQACCSSTSEASYDMDLPPPPPFNILPVKRGSSSESHATTHCVSGKTQSNHSPTQNSYSVLALCSSGEENNTSVSKHHPFVMRESEYKTKSETSSGNSDWKYGRKDSTDSMFVSIDSNCNSLPPSDFEDDISETMGEILTDATAQSEKIQYQADVKYRNRRKESLKNRRKQLEEEYRKSMPIYNELILKATNFSESEQQHLLGSSKSLLRSDRCLYSSVRPTADDYAEKCFLNHRLSCLELSCSESELDENSLHRISQTKKHHDSSQRRTPSASSLTTVTTAGESPSISSSAPYKVFHKKQRLPANRKASMSSFGSESVSSIEFGAASMNAHPLTSYNYQALVQTCPEKNQLSKCVSQASNVLHHPNENKHLHECSPSNTNSSGGEGVKTFSTTDEKRCYFDVIESSADDVSTDIEMVNLGTM